ncbi:MAG: hypothetical protein JSV49_04710 [Thermoplasmata archaeon]|nr:MAG: hypothetical protein JSV49_04710 [Thermoplasmata archaeon]
MGTAEPEYYPLEIITTIAVILTFILTALIYYEHREHTGEKNILYFGMIIVFFMYFLAENNWLLGREYFTGTIIYSLIMVIFFAIFLKHSFSVDKKIFLLFLVGMIALAISMVIDGIIDGNIPIEFNYNRRILLEEIAEAYAAILFLHSIFILYLHTIREKCSFQISRNGAAYLVGVAVILGYGNTFLLEDSGQPIPLFRIIIGIVFYIIGLILALLYFKYSDEMKRIFLKNSGDKE